MKFSIATTLVVSLAAQTTVASWFGKAPYNAWHETELERWLDDHNVKYPTPADRKDLENIVKENWDKGVTEVEAQAAKAHAESASQASSAYQNVREWIFDSWTESQLKAFLDKHKIPSPEPRNRDTFLRVARENYADVAKKAGEYAAYPGNWLYASWTDSQLKSWLDTNGVPVPQPSARDKLIATVRRNSRLASLKAQAAASSLAASAEAAGHTITTEALNAWSESDLKAWADKNGIKVPQGSNKNELVALVRKNWAKVSGDNVASSASAAFHAATTSAGNEASKASVSASSKASEASAGLFGLVNHYYTEAQIALGLQTNYLSSASRSAASATKSASSLASKASKKAEL